MADKVYFGIPGNIQEIPAPKTGMGFASNVDYEETELVSGGRSIFRAPTAYKTFNMTWGSGAARLQHLIDLYNGQFGPGPFYVTDPTASAENALPARWSNAWQLAYQANGWCRPVVDTDDGIPTAVSPKVPLTDRYVVFKQAVSGATVKTSGVLRTRLIRVPDKAYFLAVNGSATGGAGIHYRTFDSTTNTWSAPTLFTSFTGTSQQIVAAEDTKATMIELDLYLPLGSTLTLKGLALGTVKPAAGKWMPTGRGVGPVQFSGSTDGELVSSTIDRIGLSIDFTEVQNVESPIL